jgi:hypothetical protein
MGLWPQYTRVVPISGRPGSEWGRLWARRGQLGTMGSLRCPPACREENLGEAMAGRASLRQLAIAAVIFGLTAGHLASAAQADQQMLTVTVVVCPAGMARDDLPTECNDRLARAFDVSVYDAAYTPVADHITPDARGRVVVDLIGRTPADLTVVIHPAVNVGTRSVMCRADGAVLATALVGGAAAIPVFRVEVGTAADVACIIAVYGFPGDDRLLATITQGTPRLATPAATPTAPPLQR